MNACMPGTLGRSRKNLFNYFLISSCVTTVVRTESLGLCCGQCKCLVIQSVVMKKSPRVQGWSWNKYLGPEEILWSSGGHDNYLGTAVVTAKAPTSVGATTSTECFWTYVPDVSFIWRERYERNSLVSFELRDDTQQGKWNLTSNSKDSGV